MLTALEIPHLNSIVVPATGQSPAMGTFSKRLDRPLMPLLHHQALPALRVPPAEHAIAAATDQQRSGQTPGQRVHDRARLAPCVQALPTLHIPDDELPAVSASATTGQSRAIRTPRHTHNHATMPLELL